MKWLSLTSKTTPVDADVIVGTDSANSGKSVGITWANVKATLKAYFDTLYASLAGPTITQLKAYANVYPLMTGGGQHFDGSTMYLDTNALTGVVDGKAGTFFAVVRFQNAYTAQEIFFANTANHFAVSRTSGGVIAMSATNAAGTVIFSMFTTTTVAANAGTYVIAASWDLAAGAGTSRLYVNDVQNRTESTYTNDFIDYTATEFSVAGNTVGTALFTGDIYALWVDFTQRVEFNTELNRRRFYDANLTPVYLGDAGQLATGTAPGLYLALDDSASWYVNRGNLQATSFTTHGTLTDVTTPIDVQAAPLSDFGRVVTVTANYTVNRTDRLVIVNKGSACVLTLPDPAANQGRELRVLNIGGAFATTSASANVIPIAGGAASTALLPATDGASATLKANGTSWQIIDT